MSIIAKEGNKKMLVPCGLKQAVCYDVWDIGNQKGEYLGVPNVTHKIIIAWEIEDTQTSGDYAGKRYTISKFYSLSLGRKANLRHDLTSWRGKEFTDEELKGFEVENIIGVNCLLNIGTSDKGNNKILGISPITKTMQKMTPENKRSIPDWVKKFINDSVKDNSLDTIEQTEEVSVDDGEIPF